MKKTSLLILLLLLPLASAQDFTYADSITARQEVFSSLTILPQKDDYSLEYAIINLSFFPKETMQQQVLEQTTTPDAEAVGDRLIFNIKNPKMTDYYRVDSVVKTSSRRAEIKEKTSFPIAAIPGPAGFFLGPSELVDSDDPRIIGLASQIVEGEDDLFVVETKLAEWVKSNIEYNITTATESASQKATWVLSNRKGVCDEITNLFIALNRALGIPARFISGISYTNSELFAEKWGPHGWAEVYFPGTGWVPFDVTYGEFGYVDATHIVAGISKDAKEMSTQLAWYGRDVTVDFEKLRFKTEVINYTKEANFIKITASPIKDDVSFGSYNTIEAVVENLENYYAATTVGISKVNEIENVDAVEKTIVLKPNEKKSVFWMVRVIDDLSRDFAYTFPIVVYSDSGVSANATFKSNFDAESIKLEEAVTTLKSLNEETAKVYSRNVFIDCYAEKSAYYVYENKTIDCIVQNKGNVFMRNLSMCLENICGIFDLGISRQKNINFTLETNKTGTIRIDVTASGTDVLKRKTVQIEVLDTPKIEIANPDYPKNISYGRDFNISFSIKKVSASLPKNADVEFVFEDSKNHWSLSDIETDKRIIVNMNGNQLDAKQNIFKINVRYFDSNSREYTQTAEFEINLNRLNMLQKTGMFFRKISRSISKVFK